MELKVIVDVEHTKIVQHIQEQLNCKLKFVILFTIIARIEEQTSNYTNNFDVNVNEVEVISIEGDDGYESKWEPVGEEIWGIIEEEIKQRLDKSNKYAFYDVYHIIRNTALSLYYDSLIESNQIKPYKLPN